VSSQWDSLAHWQHQESALAYNGIKITKEGLSAASTDENQMPTLDHWHAGGGLVARGVLIDVKAWYEAKALAEGKTGDEAVFHPFEEHRITAAEIETIAKDQGVQFHVGDVLIIRTGMTECLENPQPADLAKLQNFQLAGMDGTLESVKWLWNKHFTAVAGDSIAFEALMPIKDDGSVGVPDDLGKSPMLELWMSLAKLILFHSPAPMAAFDVRHEYWGTMGSESFVSTLQDGQQVYFLTHICTSSYPRSGGVPSKRACHLLRHTQLHISICAFYIASTSFIAKPAQSSRL
jgi:hypothetical protein